MSAFFADDTISYALGSTPAQALIHLQSASDAPQISLLNHRLLLNAEKTKHIVFSTSTSDSDYPAIKTLKAELAILIQ